VTRAYIPISGDHGRCIVSSAYDVTAEDPHRAGKYASVPVIPGVGYETDRQPDPIVGDAIEHPRVDVLLVNEVPLSQLLERLMSKLAGRERSLRGRVQENPLRLPVIILIAYRIYGDGCIFPRSLATLRARAPSPTQRIFSVPAPWRLLRWWRSWVAVVGERARQSGARHSDVSRQLAQIARPGDRAGSVCAFDEIGRHVLLFRR